MTRVAAYCSFVVAAIVTSCARSPAPPPKQVGPAAPPLVLVVEEVAGLGLFADEAREAEDAVAAWARSRGWKIVDTAKARAVFARARAGQDPASGATCGRPLARWRAIPRYAHALGATGRVRASITCDEKGAACTLGVDAFDSLTAFEGETVAEYAGPFDARAPWRDALRRALEALVPHHEEYGMGGLGMLGGSEVHARPEKLEVSAWPARETDARKKFTLAGPTTSPLRACFTEQGGAELLVEVSNEGAIARCEARELDDDVTKCACAALVTHARGTGEIVGKRAFVGVSFRPADVVAPGGVVFASAGTFLESYPSRNGEQLWRAKVSDRSIADWEPPHEDRLARCFAGVAAPKELTARVHVTFDARGRAAAADVRSSVLSLAENACVREAFLAAATAPCPAVPMTTAEAEVRASVRAITP